MPASGFHHPHPPFGYRYELALVPEPNEQRALRIVAAMTAAGRGPTAIAAELNAAGLRNRKGGSYTKGSIRNIQLILARRGEELTERS